jgi:hypothetical protein
VRFSSTPKICPLHFAVEWAKHFRWLPTPQRGRSGREVERTPSGGVEETLLHETAVSESGNAPTHGRLGSPSLSSRQLTVSGVFYISDMGGIGSSRRGAITRSSSRSRTCEWHASSPSRRLSSIIRRIVVKKSCKRKRVTSVLPMQ